MFGLGPQELLLILLIALLLFGAKRLPEIARSLGKGIQEFKKASRDVIEDFQEDVTKSSNGDHKDKAG